MVWAAQNKLSLDVKSLVDRIIASGQMSRKEHLQLTSALLSDTKISEEDRRQINRVFDYIQTGRLKLVN
jgi:hypothetical protein